MRRVTGGGGDGEGSGGRARRTKASKTAEIAPPSVSTPALDTASTVATLDGWTELNEAAVQAAAAGAAAAEVRSSGGGSHAVDDPPRRPQMEYVLGCLCVEALKPLALLQADPVLD